MENRPSHPSFIFRSGDMVQRPPFEQQDTNMYGFFVKGQLDKLQSCIDKELNSVANGQYHFKPLSDHIILTFARINKCYSTNPKDHPKGWGVEIDVCFWIPVGSMVIKDGQEYLDVRSQSRLQCA